MQPVDARAVANYLLASAEAGGKSLDQLQLQKLTYLAHGWHLGLCGLPLIVQTVEAWPYGPVISDVYHAFKRYGSGSITGRAVYGDPVAGWIPIQATLEPYSKSVVDAVWATYGKMSGNQLITLTHQLGTPWAQVTHGLAPEQIRSIPIPNTLISSYYRDLALKNQASQEASRAART